VITLTGGLVIVTGILMMFRIDTPLWARDPYIFTDPTWGMIYVVHGLSAVSLVTLVIAHVYFGIRPEKRWITWSMILGWIDRRHYVEHHDPEQWAARSEGSSGQR
jgi:cytochrome b subunit of formate dehydrogenase